MTISEPTSQFGLKAWNTPIICNNLKIMTDTCTINNKLTKRQFWDYVQWWGQPVLE